MTFVRSHVRTFNRTFNRALVEIYLELIGHLPKLSKTGNDIIKMIKANPSITQREIGDMLDLTERTVRRYFKELIDNKVIEREYVHKRLLSDRALDQ